MVPLEFTGNKTDCDHRWKSTHQESFLMVHSLQYDQEYCHGFEREKFTKCSQNYQFFLAVGVKQVDQNWSIFLGVGVLQIYQ